MGTSAMGVKVSDWVMGVLALVGWLNGASGMAVPQEPEKPSTGFPNFKIPTLGGKQLWTDHAWRQGWRIQQNALTGHWRLLDPQNVRFAWGTRMACEAALQQQQPDNVLAAQQITILLHGLMRSASSMSALGESIVAQTQQPVLYFEYASTRATIAEHAAALRDVIASLPPEVDFNCVGHSMGNIVVRHAIGDWQQAGDSQSLSRLKHVVMLGPPNQGSSIARQLAKTGVFGWVTGRGGLELGREWERFAAHLATPLCPFGIVAGSLPESSLQNPLVDGRGDFVVSIEETKLPGAADFLEVPRLHSFLMDDATVQQAVVHFLSHNTFSPRPSPARPAGESAGESAGETVETD
ncbi:MAG: hypothetical protein KDA45_08465 [Planctomycetales bacterium]|nr:hypothetical protein [Planctomycetales bacterium]